MVASPSSSPTRPALAHGVAGGVEDLVADDDRVRVEPLVHGVPAAVVGAAEHAQHLRRVDAPAPGDAVLAVGGESHVGRPQGAAGADLRGLLAQQRHPDAQLALPLQRVPLTVEPADQHHVPVQAAQLLGRDVDVEVRVVDPFTLRGEQLDQLRAAFAGGPQTRDHLLRRWPGRGGGWGSRRLRLRPSFWGRHCAFSSSTTPTGRLWRTGSGFVAGHRRPGGVKRWSVDTDGTPFHPDTGSLEPVSVTTPKSTKRDHLHHCELRKHLTRPG